MNINKKHNGLWFAQRKKKTKKWQQNYQLETREDLATQLTYLEFWLEV